jgi:hypothetical protein
MRASKASFGSLVGKSIELNDAEIDPEKLYQNGLVTLP